jgi:hypothetical protein
MEKFKIIDESGDKKYFSQLPHYILNHSTAIDQALYWQMKRYAGENGKCFATQETLMEKMGIGRITYNKALKYLLKKDWIRFIGTTKGKTRPIKTYAIVDIWKLNIMNYEKIPSETAISFNDEIPSETIGDTVQNSSKIPSETAVEEDLSLRRTIKNTPPVAVPSNLWTKEILIWLEERRKVKFADYGKQIAALGRLKKAGYEPDDIKKSLLLMEKDSWWQDKSPDFVNLSAHIHKLKKETLNSSLYGSAKRT